MGVRIKLKDFSVNSKYKSYTQEKHFEKVIGDYLTETHKIVAPYNGWNNYQIPKLKTNIVNKELLAIQDIALIMGENESALKDSLAQDNLTSYNVGNIELIRRTDLDRFLSNSPVNGFTK